jgi:hypothetical protein
MKYDMTSLFDKITQAYSPEQYTKKGLVVLSKRNKNE